MSELLFYTSRAMTLWLFIGINKCALAPAICGHGKCVPVQTGYTCQCEPGFKLSALQTNCIGECQRGYVSFVHPRSKMSMLKHHKKKKKKEKDPFVYADLFRNAWQQHSSHPKSCHAAVFPYLMVKTLALHCLRWATAHADWIQIPNFGNKQCWNRVLPWVWCLFLLSSTVTFCFLLQM